MANKNAKKYPAIPEPDTSPVALRSSILSLKEGQEVLIGVRGDRKFSAVTWSDLVDLGLIKASDIP
jgi:hypothetical protein